MPERLDARNDRQGQGGDDCVHACVCVCMCVGGGGRDWATVQQSRSDA